MKRVEKLKVQIFADGADKVGMLEMYKKSFIKGLTTNPTLMKKAGIKDYEAFAKDILSEEKLSINIIKSMLKKCTESNRNDLSRKLNIPIGKMNNLFK